MKKVLTLLTAATALAGFAHANSACVADSLANYIKNYGTTTDTAC